MRTEHQPRYITYPAEIRHTFEGFGTSHKVIHDGLLLASPFAMGIDVPRKLHELYTCKFPYPS